MWSSRFTVSRSGSERGDALIAAAASLAAGVGMAGAGLAGAVPDPARLLLGVRVEPSSASRRVRFVTAGVALATGIAAGALVRSARL